MGHLIFLSHYLWWNLQRFQNIRTSKPDARTQHHIVKRVVHRTSQFGDLCGISPVIQNLHIPDARLTLGTTQAQTLRSSSL